MNYVDNPLEGKYEEFLELLDALCDSYDNSELDILALSISAAIRVLVHDTKNSTSLLNHLNRKNIDFLSTNYQNSREKIHLGLVRKINADVNDGVGGEA